MVTTLRSCYGKKLYDVYIATYKFFWREHRFESVDTTGMDRTQIETLSIGFDDRIRGRHETEIYAL